MAVCVGHGIRISVERGRLTIKDSPGGTTREQWWPRAGHKLQRIVIVGSSGSVTLAAMQWCGHMGVPVIVVAPTGQVLSTSAYAGRGLAKNDSRLRRA